MSHNPTYDPEEGYGVDRSGSGHSTPRQFYAPATSDPPYSNMASYRQATAGPPSYATDSAAGNGKSYRYATEDPIPEDEDEPDTGADSRTVQFTSEPSHQKRMKSESRSGGVGNNSLCMKLLVAGIIIASLLAVIFLALYISEATSQDRAGSVSGNDKSNVNTVKEATTSASAQTTQQGTTLAPLVTTMAPDILEDNLGTYGGEQVKSFTLKNPNGMEVELLSLGARINKLKAMTTRSNIDIVAGFPTTGNATDLTAIANDRIFGAVDGPICGVVGNTLHKINFEATKMGNGVVFKKRIASGRIDLEVKYTLTESNQVRVAMTGKLVGPTEENIDVCDTVSFRLDTGNNFGGSHKLTVNGDRVIESGEWNNVGGQKELVNADLSVVFTRYNDFNSNQRSIDDRYEIAGTSGLRNVATLESSTSDIKVMVQSNQRVLRLYIPLLSDFAVSGKREYKNKDFVTFSTRSQAGLLTDIDSQTLLKPGAMYESVTVYTIS